MTQFTKRAAGLMVAMQVATEVATKTGGTVDFYTTPEDGLVAVVIETLTGLPPFLSLDQMMALSAVGMRYEPEFTDEWTEGSYPALVGTFNGS